MNLDDSVIVNNDVNQPLKIKHLTHLLILVEVLLRYKTDCQGQNSVYKLH